MKKQHESKNKREALQAIKRILHEKSEEEFIRDSKIIGRAIASEINQRENATIVKAPNIRGIKAAKEFENFAKKHLIEIQYFDKFYDRVSESINYDVIVPRLFFDNDFDKGIVQKFAMLLNEAEGIDISTEKENPDMKGMIYLDISFPTVIRIFDR